LNPGPSLYKRDALPLRHRGKEDTGNSKRQNTILFLWGLLEVALKRGIQEIASPLILPDGGFRESNPGLLRPKLRIIPLDQIPKSPYWGSNPEFSDPKSDALSIGL
jgi:hypothetical protein